MKRGIGFLLLLFTIAVPRLASATVSNDKFGYLYYSPGMLLSPIGSIRFGNGSWEGGLLGGGVIGFDKIFHASGSSTYVAFGPGLIWTTPALYGAAGVEWKIFDWLKFRSELGTIASCQRPIGSVLMGLALHL